MAASWTDVKTGGAVVGLGIEGRTRALACLGAAIARGAPRHTLRWLTDWARGEGATNREIIGTLLVVAPIVGTARLAKVAPDLAFAAGFNIEDALEIAD
jgi:alkylhydroperoxidase/carboxymuconolactone decarboxylase family protein YurZ